MYVCICAYKCLSICTYVLYGLCLYVDAHKHVHTGPYVCLTKYMCMYVCRCMCVFVYVDICLCVYNCKHVNLSVSLFCQLLFSICILPTTYKWQACVNVSPLLPHFHSQSVTL